MRWVQKQNIWRAEFNELLQAAARLAATLAGSERRGTKFHLPKLESKDG